MTVVAATAPARAHASPRTRPSRCAPPPTRRPSGPRAESSIRGPARKDAAVRVRPTCPDQADPVPAKGRAGSMGRGRRRATRRGPGRRLVQARLGRLQERASRRRRAPAGSRAGRHDSDPRPAAAKEVGGAAAGAAAPLPKRRLASALSSRRGAGARHLHRRSDATPVRPSRRRSSRVEGPSCPAGARLRLAPTHPRRAASKQVPRTTRRLLPPHVLDLASYSRAACHAKHRHLQMAADDAQILPPKVP